MRILFEILGILLLALLVWFAGPYFAFADFHPLAPVSTRLTVTVLIVVVWGALKTLKFVKAHRASAQLASEMAKQRDPAPSSDERSEEHTSELQSRP